MNNIHIYRQKATDYFEDFLSQNKSIRNLTAYLNDLKVKYSCDIYNSDFLNTIYDGLINHYNKSIYIHLFDKINNIDLLKDIILFFQPSFFDFVYMKNLIYYFNKNELTLDEINLLKLDSLQKETHIQTLQTPIEPSIIEPSPIEPSPIEPSPIEPSPIDENDEENYILVPSIIISNDINEITINKQTEEQNDEIDCNKEDEQQFDDIDDENDIELRRHYWDNLIKKNKDETIYH